MSKRMKRWLGVALSFVMVMAMGITAAAKDSPTASGSVSVISATDAKGVSWRLGIRPVSDGNKDTAEAIKNKDALKNALGSGYVDGMEVIETGELYIEGDIASVAWPVTGTFKVPGVLSGTKVAVLCYVDGEWKVLETVAGNGTITLTLPDASYLSLVAFVVDKNTASGTVGTSGTTSPKTGESMAVPFAGAFAMVLLVGAAFCFRKREAR